MTESENTKIEFDNSTETISYVDVQRQEQEKRYAELIEIAQKQNQELVDICKKQNQDWAELCLLQNKDWADFNDQLLERQYRVTLIFITFITIVTLITWLLLVK